MGSPMSRALGVRGKAARYAAITCSHAPTYTESLYGSEPQPFGGGTVDRQPAHSPSAISPMRPHPGICTRKIRLSPL